MHAFRVGTPDSNLSSVLAPTPTPSCKNVQFSGIPCHWGGALKVSSGLTQSPKEIWLVLPLTS